VHSVVGVNALSIFDHHLKPIKMKLSTDRIIEKYNFWASKLATASNRTDKKNATEMKNVYATMLFQRNIQF